MPRLTFRNRHASLRRKIAPGLLPSGIRKASHLASENHIDEMSSAWEAMSKLINAIIIAKTEKTTG
jgi:hypothetical protein